MYTIKKQIFQGDCTLETLCECNIIRIYPALIIAFTASTKETKPLEDYEYNPIDGIAGSVKFEF
jgi:hypothetical protein